MSFSSFTFLIRFLPIALLLYYFFFDRHSDATNPKDDSAFLDESRPSYNFTVAIYDSDTNMLYYARVDT